MPVIDLLHQNALADNDLLLKNNARGDVFEKPRDVDFAFKTTDRGKAEYLSEFMKGKNFGQPKIDSGEEGLLWIIVTIRMPITQHLLCSVSGFMVLIAGLFHVEYDGWGCVLQKK
jgi:hypothetical protein